MKNQSGNAADADRRNREFLVLLGQHELQLAACVHALIPSWQDAEDILQETKLQLWQEFATFRLGSDFLAWARTVARYVVRTHVKRNRRKPLFLSDELSDILMDRIFQMPEQADRHLEILADCVKKLSEEAFYMLQRCYVDKQKIKDIADELQRSQSGTYSAMSRIRRDLFDCVREGMRKENNP
ncbi:MAG: sigma-70 family RNA polymerase sigma factor [Pirellulaceae bacterium]|nr:sigma-70 family RNA polymerase sigma factor [Pirellulaceae bacterium]